jgi:hypothetical protein
MKSDQRVFCNTSLQNHILKCEIGCNVDKFDRDRSN